MRIPLLPTTLLLFVAACDTASTDDVLDEQLVLLAAEELEVEDAELVWYDSEDDALDDARQTAPDAFAAEEPEPEALKCYMKDDCGICYHYWSNWCIPAVMVCADGYTAFDCV